MSNYVIFSIDDVNDVHKLSKFLHHVSVLDAMQKTKGKLKVCIGSYKGEMEQSFIMHEDDFHHVSAYVKGQESFLYVRDGHKGVVYADLHYNDGETVPLGQIKAVSKDEAMQQDAWTYRPDMNVYWVTV